MFTRANAFVDKVTSRPLLSIEWVICLTAIASAIVNFITKASDDDVDNFMETETAIHVIFGFISIPIVLQLIGLMNLDKYWSKPFRKAGLLCTSVAYIFLAMIRMQVLGIYTSVWILDVSRAVIAGILYLSLRWNE